MPLSVIPEYLIRALHYRSLAHLSPAPTTYPNPGVGLFEGTPIVNTEFLNHIRKGRAEYTRGDTLRLTANGVFVNERKRGSKPGDDSDTALLGQKEIQADVVVIATGYKKPSLRFFRTRTASSHSNGGKRVNGSEEGETEEDRLFPGKYKRPDLYLQTFATGDWSVLLTNCAYENAIGTSIWLPSAFLCL